MEKLHQATNSQQIHPVRHALSGQCAPDKASSGGERYLQKEWAEMFFRQVGKHWAAAEATDRSEPTRAVVDAVPSLPTAAHGLLVPFSSA